MPRVGALLANLPAGVSASAPDSRPRGWLLWVTRLGRGARVSWSRVWSQGWNRGAIELPTELPPGCLQAPWASPREARAGPGRGHSSSPAQDSSGKGTGLVREGLGEGGLCRVGGTGAWARHFSLSSFPGLSAPHPCDPSQAQHRRRGAQKTCRRGSWVA